MLRTMRTRGIISQRRTPDRRASERGQVDGKRVLLPPSGFRGALELWADRDIPVRAFSGGGDAGGENAVGDFGNGADEERVDHGDVPDDDGDKGLTAGPAAGLLRAVDGVLCGV